VVSFISSKGVASSLPQWEGVTSSSLPQWEDTMGRLCGGGSERRGIYTESWSGGRIAVHCIVNILTGSLIYIMIGSLMTTRHFDGYCDR